MYVSNFFFHPLGFGWLTAYSTVHSSYAVFHPNLIALVHKALGIGNRFAWPNCKTGCPYACVTQTLRSMHDLTILANWECLSTQSWWSYYECMGTANMGGLFLKCLLCFTSLSLRSKVISSNWKAIGRRFTLEWLTEKQWGYVYSHYFNNQGQLRHFTVRGFGW